VEHIRGNVERGSFVNWKLIALIAKATELVNVYDFGVVSLLLHDV
jgi:hypothetical protein